MTTATVADRPNETRSGAGSLAPPLAMRQQHHSSIGPSPATTVVVAACAYEVVANGVNAWLGYDAMPLLVTRISVFTWRAFGRRLLPSWAPVAGLVAGGFVMRVAAGQRAKARARKQRDRTG